MATDQGSTRHRPALTFTRAWVCAGLLVGVLDIADALVFYGLRGVAPHLIFQSIASGLLGHAAFTGGVPTMLLGAGLHFFISFVIALLYLVASGPLPALAERPWVWGPAYGFVAWLMMYHVVLPLSAAKAGAQAWPVLVDEIGIHLFGVGLPVALIASRLRRQSKGERR